MKLGKYWITYILSLVMVVMMVSIAHAGYWKMQGEPIFEYGPNDNKAREWVGQGGTKIQLLDFNAEHFTIKESLNIGGESQTLTYRAEFTPPNIVIPDEIVAIRATVTAIDAKFSNHLYLAMDLPGCQWLGWGGPAECIRGQQMIEVKTVGASINKSNTSVRAQAPPAYLKDVQGGVMVCGIIPTAWSAVSIRIPYIWVDQTPPTTVTSHKPVSSGMPPSDPIIVSSFNSGGVQSGPMYSTAFILKVPYRITYMHNYHYFNNGKLPGTIALRHDDGTMYGPWQAQGAAGYGNVPNGYWVVRPNIEIKPGRYTVIDSDPSTWSYNEQSKGSGFVEIRGVKLASQNAQPQARQEKPAASSSGGEKARDGRFIAYNNGTVMDTKTGLMWAAKDNGGGINWANAKSYCENYRGGGYTDWRMPTQDELAGLYDPKVMAKNDLHLTNLIDFTHAYGWASDTRGSEVAQYAFQYTGGRGWRQQSFDDGCHRALPVRSGK